MIYAFATLRKKLIDRQFQVTDVQLKYTRDGKFRHFGFIGFKTEKDAQEAQKFFNKTFIGASKVSVELSADLGDKNKPR